MVLLAGLVLNNGKAEQRTGISLSSDLGENMVSLFPKTRVGIWLCKCYGG